MKRGFSRLDEISTPIYPSENPMNAPKPVSRKVDIALIVTATIAICLGLVLLDESQSIYETLAAGTLMVLGSCLYIIQLGRP